RPEHRRLIRLDSIGGALRSVLGSRQTVGYMLAAGAFFGALFGYINSAQQVLVEVYGLGAWFPAVFAATAFGLAISSFVNSRLVERYGMRLLSHGACCVFTLLTLTMFVIDRAGLLDAAVFVGFMMLTMPLVGLIFSNFNALAMAPQGHVAGIASSVIGSVTVLVGAGVGYFIGQAFDGTTTPLALGFGLSGIATLLILLVTERGRLFQPGSAS
ncbi:MAG TPA: MFS transporter, partial [Paracoccaceae bacterium]|nr:MFS transporter [Paracoccaceae bacterium]